jgi:catechol 2,3-dioxygenase-like lactoylglutathione lyase family enzyme
MRLMKSMVNAINHVTLQDLDRSFSFYTNDLGLHPVARWYKSAYLLAGSDWICLNLDPAARSVPLPEYTHLAFTIPAEEFSDAVIRLQEAGVTSWQKNRSHGDSFYFLDPDGHKLEIHTSDLNARMESLRREPPKELVFFRSDRSAQATIGEFLTTRRDFRTATSVGWVATGRARRPASSSTIRSDYVGT